MKGIFNLEKRLQRPEESIRDLSLNISVCVMFVVNIFPAAKMKLLTFNLAETLKIVERHVHNAT